MSSAFINRANTTNNLLETTTAIAFPEHGDRRKIVSFSNYHMTRRAKLLGHVLRSNKDDPLRQIFFCRILPREWKTEREGAVAPDRPGCILPKNIFMAYVGPVNYVESMYEDNMIHAAAQRRDF